MYVVKCGVTDGIREVSIIRCLLAAYAVLCGAAVVMNRKLSMWTAKKPVWNSIFPVFLSPLIGPFAGPGVAFGFIYKSDEQHLSQKPPRRNVFQDNHESIM
jgi:hypothetical protein